MEPSNIKNKILSKIQSQKNKFVGGDPTQDPPQDLTQDPPQDPTEEPLEGPPTQDPSEEPLEGPPTQDSQQDPTEEPLEGPPTQESLEVPPAEEPSVDEPLSNEEFMFKDTRYKLTNEHLLEKNFSNLESSKSYKIKLCIYSIVTENTPTPYLRYVLNKITSENGEPLYVFPEFDFTLDNIDQPLSNEDVENITQEPTNMDVEGPNDTKIEAEILEQCKTTILEIFNFLNHSENADFNKMFKGFFVPTTENQDTILFVFDTTEILPTNLVERTQTEYVWAVLYEMLCSKKWRTTSISDEIYNYFKEIIERNSNSMDMHHIKTQDDEYLKSPYLLFLCNNDNMEYQNCFKDESNINHPVNLLFPRIQHPKIGDYFIFTVEPINPEDSRTLRRFLVFFDDADIATNYIEESDESVVQQQLDSIYTMDSEDTPNYNGYVFMENNKQLWVMKNREKIVELQ